MRHSGLSQPTISPKDTLLQRQYVGSLGSMGMSRSTLKTRASLMSPTTAFLATLFFFILRPGLDGAAPSSIFRFLWLLPPSTGRAVWLRSSPRASSSASKLRRSTSRRRMCLSTISYVCTARATFSSANSMHVLKSLRMLFRDVSGGVRFSLAARLKDVKYPLLFFSTLASVSCDRASSSLINMKFRFNSAGSPFTLSMKFSR
mmetsp:Transcript_16192/g.41562  ORF Transcript_16192/g.41562 Transcript_16192/m.41562 type:complete len:203 (-) Transcript_16192:88-696(-)